jgi:two-component system chemotaxis response regulator CheY
VVISAMHLSDINGVELARQLRSEIKVNAPGFILVTSESDEGESASLSKLNRVLLLPKPFTAGQLVEAINLATGVSVTMESQGLSAGAPPRGADKADRGQKRVLIVDDSGTTRLHERNVLKGLGFSQFVEVEDGAHAIAVAARDTFHLIVTDYNMPLMDGRALVSYLKQNPPTATIPIIMVTTETDAQKLDLVRKLGVVAILDKVFSPGVVGPLLDKLF